ncbi:MAG: flagellar biosynthesis protein FlhB [Succinivibrionaceae bacterium]
MAENDGQERSEEPTGKRISDARKKGQVPRSREMGTLSVLLSGIIGLWLFSPFFLDAFREIFQLGLSVERHNLFSPDFLVHALLSSIGIVALPVALLGFLVIFCALMGNILVGGYNFSLEVITPKFNKINPLTGLKRIFGINSVVELVKSILKVAFVGSIAYVLISSSLNHILQLPSYRFPDSIFDCLHLVLFITIGIICALIPIAGIDSWFQKWHTHEQLKMTKQEVKDEMKDTEGKPEVKSRIRRLQIEMATRHMMQNVPKADVVVTNPTHYAVALKYDQFTPHSAPVVVAKGTDEIALKIREIAAASNVTIIEAPPLARAIYYSTDLDRTIPEGLFAAVAQVLAYVFQLKMYRARRGLAPRPLDKNLPIPEELQHD